ncbi:hypothetical protein B0H16DRAFT_1730884 [Mycena metata]|uniref:F-box domain-containing protein n=1 Tax=Mycena metata TaxID=1033252 RepID=A0AAD7I6Q1_9AGAR|nr:hypothetical protein B0H16DRAFT_1730884 [Mycena metata]
MPLQFTALPTELLDSVASHVPLRDLLALCQTSHKLYDASLWWIYHTVSTATVACAVESFKVPRECTVPPSTVAKISNLDRNRPPFNYIELNTLRAEKKGGSCVRR